MIWSLYGESNSGSYLERVVSLPLDDRVLVEATRFELALPFLQGRSLPY